MSVVSHFTDQNLYGPAGPVASDIKQDLLGDCYLIATMASAARQHPQHIRNMIYYDKYSQSFAVRMYDVTGHRKTIRVTQGELADNIKRKGASWVDNTGKYQRTWPAVVETAYAKMYDSNPSDGLQEGYQKIANGGWPKDAMMAITGSLGTELAFKILPPLTRQASIALFGHKVAVALRRKKVVTLWSVTEKDSRGIVAKALGLPIPQDGLVDNHVYTVMKMTMSHSGWIVTLRNPWGTNMGVGEGKDMKSPIISVALQKLVDTGGLNSFRISDHKLA